MGNSLLLPCKLLWREWKAGELRLLLAALLVAVAASCAVGFFSDRVEQALVGQTAEFLGGDLVVASPRPFDGDLEAQARASGLSYSRQLVFPSMLINQDRMLLGTIKAIDQHYPLKGQLKVASSRQQAPEIETRGPQPGHIWLEPRILQNLDLQVGDQVELGTDRLLVSRILLHEPDRGGGLFSLQPRALMHQSDLEKIQVIQPGSRVRYRYLFSGPPASLDALRDWLAPRLKPGQQILDIKQENASLGSTLERAQSYLRLSGLLAVIMAAIAVAMAARRFTERHFDQAALLRCLGLRQRQILRLYLLQLLIAGTLASSCGVALGWLAQQGLIALMAELLPGDLPEAGWQPALAGLATGLLILIGFSLPPLLRLSLVSPLRVLRRELTPLPIRAWLVYLLAGGIMIMLLLAYSQSLKLTLLVAGLGSLGTLLLGLLAWLLLKLAARIPGPMSWRLAHKHLLRHPADSLSQLFAFGITLAAMTLILTVRNDLVDRWQQQLPEQAPNNFLINIQPWQLQPLNDFFRERGIEHSGIYPMVRGRLSHINGVAAEQWLEPESPGRRAIRRELNLTWSETLAPDNRIVDGRWWQPGDRGRPLISLERGLARDLGVGIGDRLRFNFGDRTLESTVASLRSLEWGSLRPNFFVIFPPGALDALPASYITSFYLPLERSRLLNELMHQFPTLTLLEVERLLSNIRQIITQVSIAVEYVMLFVLAAGITVMLAALANSLDERLREGALIRTLGGNRRILSNMLALEFILTGALAGLLACVLNEVILFWLYDQLLRLEYSPSPILWLLTPPLGALLVVVAGTHASRKVITLPPIRVLREL